MTSSVGAQITERSESVQGMRIDWDVPVPMTDGAVLRADVFRPDDDGVYPVLMTFGPYGKGLAFQEGFAPMWQRLSAAYPDAVAGSSNRYQVWETPDPEKWIPDGYICVRVDSRGAGRSAGLLDMLSPQEARDYYEAIEWAGTRGWSNGRVGLLGISYYAANQWLVAALRPPHLAAICPWEGFTDFYRDLSRHGGIFSRFGTAWQEYQIFTVQHGVGERGRRNPNTGDLVAGPETLSDEELAANRVETIAETKRRVLLDEFSRARTPDLTRIEVPVLSAANWAHHLHTRGNFDGWDKVSSTRKWLEVHGHEHYAEFYTDYGVDLQKRFFGHFLKNEATGWGEQPPVRLNIRHVDGTFEGRDEREWPLARTQWTRFYLDAGSATLAPTPPVAQCTVGFAALGPGAEFWTAPLAEPLEITGPASARIRVASSTADADLFVTLRVRDPENREISLVSAIDEHGVIAVGWLRASHRELDEAASLPYRPWHPHTRTLPLTPGQIVDLDVEIWPTSIVVPQGYRLGVTISGRDFQIPGDGPWPVVYGIEQRGNGVFVHDDPDDRPAGVFDGTTTLHTGPGAGSSLLLPVIPAC
ncbi:CocE/NonD family hydrolase [Nocardia canadensis]|uniref:CocE/NonD family hydrolase n=1 Tax=Nocardia canadensis TaxID=3065238 RepID=UPI002931BB66|nr:CocE/NonD family hydrolase [Nocardia canadensis]